jgi:hypothetical protein
MRLHLEPQFRQQSYEWDMLRFAQIENLLYQQHLTQSRFLRQRLHWIALFELQ